MHRLPSRITAVMIGTILIFAATIIVSTLWLTRALDNQARRDSTQLVRSTLAGMLDGAERVNLEYAKWDELAGAAERRDMDWLYRNMGSTAATGLATDLVVLWGGPFAQDVGWIDQSSRDGTPGLVSPHDLAMADLRLDHVPLGSAQGESFFVRQGDDLFVAAVARVEWWQDVSRAEADDVRIPRLLMGHRIGREQVNAVAKATLLQDLRIDRQAPSGRPAVGLRGSEGHAVAWLSWDAPRPGTRMLGRMAPFLLAATLLATALAVAGMMLTRRGAQALVRAEQRSLVAARTNTLTGLPNRAAFNDVLAAPARAGERAVLFLDINDFKRINDSIGHEAGDRVLVHVAQRLIEFSMPDCLLARIAGDEFVFVITGANAEGQTRELADRVQRALADPFSVLGHQVQVTIAMGYAVQAMDDTTDSDLVRQADLAMYEAKRRKGQPGLVAYSAVIEQASRDALVIEQGLRRALARTGELFIAYQPIVNADGRLERAEALARWTSPELGPVPPDRFIAVAEQAGLIVELGRRLFQLVCDNLAAHPDLEVSVNVSTLQLMAPDFIPMITDELASRSIDPARVEVELTEAVVVDDARLAAQRVENLRAAGFSIALDDFGTGYSSVGYLEQLRFDTLKIDRSFVSKVRASAKGIAVVQGMITMAHGLDLRVVCEGVETAEDLDLLRALGADLAQGFHLDRPLPIGVLVDRWLHREKERAAVA